MVLSLYFDNVRVPAENMMGEEDKGFIQIMENFNIERMCMCASSLGMMKVKTPNSASSYTS